jgi:hypothetical protein
VFVRQKLVAVGVLVPVVSILWLPVLFARGVVAPILGAIAIGVTIAVIGAAFVMFER